MGLGWVIATEPHVGRDTSLPAQGYRLDIGEDGVHIVGADAAGEFYGQATLDQLARHQPGRLPAVRIIDWPDIAVRGVMLDVSRDKVPTMATLEALVDQFAALKLNHLQLYTEHTFAYAGHEPVWADASPFTADDIRDLDVYCARRHVELTANQNCLGHMERWLRHERYRALATCPDGWTDERGWNRAPTTMDPANPGSLALARELLAQLVPAFNSRRVNVGLDEPWELAERFDDYLRYVWALRAVPELHGRQMLMWGDILANHPERLADLPSEVTICEWGYEATHDFAARAERLAGTGIPFWVCPGTSSWNSIVGRTTNARENLRAAAAAGLAHDAQGFLITDWGDNGHLQYLPVSEPSFAYGAAVSWCGESNADVDLGAALDHHVFLDQAGRLGQAILDLGDVYRLVAPQMPNNSALVLHLYYPQVVLGARYTEGLSTTDLAAVEEAIEDALARVEASDPQRADGSTVVQELQAAGGLMSLLCRDAKARLTGDGSLRSVPAATRHALASELDDLIDGHRGLWLARNRSGGLTDSTARLERLRTAYLEPPTPIRP